MRRFLPALIGLGAALLLLAAVLWLRDHRQRAAARPRPAFGAQSPDDVVRLRIHYRGDSVTLLRAGDGGWRVSLDSFPADTARLRRVLGHLLAMQTREKASDSADAARLAELGFSGEEAKRVEWTLGDGRVRRVVLGRTSGLDFGSTYWKLADAPQVYRTPGRFVWEISSRHQDWKDTNLHVPLTESDVRAVEAWWMTPGGVAHEYALEKVGDTTFRLTRPRRAPARRAPASALFRYATQFKVDEFPAEVDSAPRAHLDQPVMTVRILLRDGSERRIIAGAEVDRLYRHVKHPWHPAPVRVFKWRFDYFAKRAEDFVDSAEENRP